MRAIQIRPRAERQIEAAVIWYQAQRTSLGEELLLDLSQAFERIARFPEANPVVAEQIRRGLCARFPYRIYYSADHASVVIHALRHFRQDDRQIPDQLTQPNDD